MACKDESYEVTGKVCPPKMPMDNVTLENWQNLPPAFLDSLFSESSFEGSKIIQSTSLCALLSQASVVLSSDGLSHSSVSLPYYFCNFCDHNTASKLNLLRHIAEKHVFKCQLCDDFVSFTRCGLLQHQLQKHVDAEEMQPVLSAKTVQLSTSELLRNIKYLTQLSASLNTIPADTVNSSLLNKPSKDIQTLNDSNNFLTGVGSSNDLNSYETKDPDKSSIIQLKGNTTSDVTVSVIDSIFEEAKSKIRLDRKEGIETIEKSTSQLTMKECNRKNSNLRQPHGMPHFLNDADTSVTSSSSRQYSLSPPVAYRPSHNATRHSEKNSNGIQTLVPSFLCEPSPVVRITENKYVNLNCENIKSERGDKENLKECDNSSMSPSSSSSLCKQMLTTTSQKKDAEVRERSLSPNLSSLSVERLQKQLEEAVSNSPGFVFIESSDTALGKSEVHSNCKEKTGSTMDNFLMDNEDFGNTSQGVHPFTLIRSNSDGLNDKSQPLSSTKLTLREEKYDLLRNLLEPRPNHTALTHCSRGKSEFQLKFKHDKVTVHNNTNEMSSKPLRADSKSSKMCLVRASDMTLKELLIGSVPKVNNLATSTVNKDVCAQSMPIYLVCGFCNSEFHNKAHFDNHMGACKNLPNSPKESQKVDQTGTNNCDLAIKQELEEVDIAFTGLSSSRPSGEFTASGLLKSLTDQCLGVAPKTHRHDTDFHSSDDSTSASVSDNHLDMRNCMVSERKGDRIKNNYDAKSTGGNGNLSTQSKNTAASSPNFVSTEENDRVNNVLSKSYTRKRKNEYEEDADYVYESEENAESDYSSESDYRQNSTRNLKNKKFIKDSERLRSQVAKRVCKKPLAMQPSFHLTCLHCKFVTESQTEMRHHLISRHTNNVPFCKATIEHQKETLLYFCCGINSSCTFFSTEAAEIFQHIKLCYSGHLDHYIEHMEEEHADYAQVLCSLGIAAKKIDSSPSVFYCLRCNFSNNSLQRVACHAKTNHSEKVAGVMFINRMPSETKVLMVCLNCNSHIPVKNWAVHPCRKTNSTNVKGTSSRTLNNSSVYSAYVEQGKVSLLCELVAAEKGKIVQCFSEKTDKISSDSSANQNYEKRPSNVPLQSQGTCELLVKQEILDVEDSNDMPIYFPSNNLSIDNTSQANFKPDTANNFEMAHMTGFNGLFTKELKDSSHSRVLHNLLSAPGKGDDAPKSPSLLQNLLRSSHTTKEQLRLPFKPFMTSKPLPAQPSNAKYSTMLETLSRQASHTNQHQLVAAKLNITNGRAQTSPPRASTDAKYANAFQKTKTKESEKPDSTFMSTQKAPSQRLVSNIRTPPLSVTVNEAAQLSPPLIPRPPLLPLIPPLSPSRSEENQGSHAPFSNLLRGLLCKVNPRPANSQNDPAF